MIRETDIVEESDLDILLEKYEELHSLLCDYNQVEMFVGQIHEIIQEAIYELPEGTKVGFRPLCMPTRWLIENFDFSHVKIVGIFDIDKVLHFAFKGIPILEPSSEEAQSVDIFIMTSFNEREVIVSDLKQGKQMFLDVYDCLWQKGIQLYAPLDYYIEGCPAILHYYLMRLENTKKEEQETALRELLTVACEEKDFVMLERFCKQYASDYPFACQALEKYREFYALICGMIAKRKQRDIVLYWMDAVPYKWKGYFKKLMDLEKEGLCFEQAYTCTPYTYQTIRAMFSGLLPLSDWQKSMEEVGYGNSELVHWLVDRHYKVCWVGGDVTRCFEEDFSDYLFINISCNIVLWKILCKMLASSDPVFLVAGFMETHPPMFCAELKRMVDVYKTENPLVQFQVSADYLEQRVMYYHKVLRGGKRIQIIMSDHGEHVTNELSKWCWMQNKLHAYCFLMGSGIQSRRESKVFSYLKFTELVKWLVEPEKYDYEDCLSDYAVFQDTDIYSAEATNQFIKSGKADMALAYRGALDGTYKYAVNRMGREFFYKIVDDTDVEIEEGEAMEYFARLRNLAGTVFPDLSSCEKFKYVTRIYEAVSTNCKDI